MKLVIFFIALTCFQASADGYAQKISLSEKNAPVGKVLDQIKKQSGYILFYESKLIKNTDKVNISLANATITQALDAVLRGLPLSYSIIENTVVIKRREEFVKLSLPVKVAITIRGKVTDSKGEPLLGVIIKIKGTTQATTTDAEGMYSINIPNEASTLVFTFLGFNPLEVDPKGKTAIDVTLIEQPNSLNEVIVVGYGVQKKGEPYRSSEPD